MKNQRDELKTLNESAVSHASEINKETETQIKF